MMRSLLTLLSVFVVGQMAAAQLASPELSHAITPKEAAKLKWSPSYHVPRFYFQDKPVWQPATEFNTFQYVLFSSRTINEEAKYLREMIAKNLPADMKLVVLVTPTTYAANKAVYSKFASSDRIIYAVNNDNAGSEWARDAFPVPVVNPTSGETTLIGANYFRTFTSGQSIADAVQLPLKPYKFTFVGGNILADKDGTCFVVKSDRMFNTTEDDLKNAYGCVAVRLMPYVAGIGDVDEVLKPLDGKKMLTNQPSYVNDLKAWGYDVIMLPQAPHFRTYANSLLINKTVFMPTYNLPTDAEATQVYQSLGYKVIGIPSESMSEDFAGSVHCQTMAYPPMQQKDLFSILNIKSINE